MKKLYQPEHINYALVEGTRPPMYSAMKYWGRKPHNIWNDYIKHYCPEDGVVLDPFVGSGITAFESMKLGRNVIAMDLNPLSAFVIETVTSDFDKEEFERSVKKIISTVADDDVYKAHFVRKVGDAECTVYNYIWERGRIKYVRVKDAEGVGRSVAPGETDANAVASMANLHIPYWYPTDDFPQNPSINHAFITKIGGTTVDNLWTKRNLYVLSKIFDLIQKQKGVALRSQLMYAFIHTLHLVSKMVVPRSERGNRDFSGSWGRADYMIRNRSMEQNPLIVFHRSCFDKQGVINALEDAHAQIPSNPKLNFVNVGKKTKDGSVVNYGIVDIADMLDYIEPESIDFVLTDPPYGGLVQYMDLSMVWLVWLQKFDKRFTPDASGEITYKRGVTDRATYRQRLLLAFKNLYKILKPDHYMVVTFHNQDIREWNDFVSAIRESGFVFEKVTHQYNKRSGESNVSNPYGTTASDFYIRCKKTSTTSKPGDKDDLTRFVINKTRQILTERGEETPFEFLINGLLPDMLQAGYLEPDQPAEAIMTMLSSEIGPGKLFCLKENGKNKGGDIFWFNDPSSVISHIAIPLHDRVETTIRSLMRRRVSVKYDDIVAEIFREFPNGLTPDPRGLRKIVEKFAVQSNGKWKLRDNVERDCTEHTRMIDMICKIAKRAGLLSYVGVREQHETLSGGKKLVDVALVKDISVLSGYDDSQRARIGMIDAIWVNNQKTEVSAVFEVENSTDFIGAVGRASHLASTIPKFMIIPEHRLSEFLRFVDPLFISSFRDNSWRYLSYADVQMLATARDITIDQIVKMAKER